METDTSKLMITGKSIIIYEGTETEVFHWNWTVFQSNDFHEWKWLCKNENEGLFFYGGLVNDTSYIFEKSLVVKFPVTLNDSWTKNVFHYSGGAFYNADTSTVVCASTNEVFISGIGDLNCIQYDEVRPSGEGHLETESYYCKNIGFVGLVLKRNGHLELKKTLLSVDLSTTNLKSEIIKYRKTTGETYIFHMTN